MVKEKKILVFRQEICPLEFASAFELSLYEPSSASHESFISYHEHLIAYGMVCSSPKFFFFFFKPDINQERIVEEGGLDALLMLLRSSQNATILRVTSGAIANMAMNGNIVFRLS